MACRIATTYVRKEGRYISIRTLSFIQLLVTYYPLTLTFTFDAAIVTIAPFGASHLTLTCPHLLAFTAASALEDVVHDFIGIHLALCAIDLHLQF